MPSLKVLNICWTQPETDPREPFDLRRLLLVYNLGQTVFNCWLFYSVFWLWRDHYSWTCQPVDYSDRFCLNSEYNPPIILTQLMIVKSVEQL